MPAISLRLAEPPSVVGTGGGHIGEKEPGAVAVELAAWVDVSGISPGNSKGAWEVVPEPEPAAAPEPAAPALPFPDPVAVDDCCDVPDGDVACEPDDVDAVDDVEDVGVEPTALLLLLVRLFICGTVWASAVTGAVAMPRNMITMMKTRCIALSCVECTALPPVLLDNARSAKK
jgi:hypothetical protein